MAIRYVPLILLGVLLNAVAQILMKAGMIKIGHFEFSMANLVPVGIKTFTSPYVLVALACYVISVLVWLAALSKVEVSYAYPLLSIGYIVTALYAQFRFMENLSPTRWAGIIVICIGVYLITRTG
ncbi:MAG: EamA family transporter [Deltaproteobacteria bacterium]|nr:EamA family transporter [Deltaproteobacteria bacterium]